MKYALWHVLGTNDRSYELHQVNRKRKIESQGQNEPTVKSVLILVEQLLV